MSTALVANPRGITGDRAEIEAARQRILNMIPGSDGVPSEVLFATAQLSVSLGLNPIASELYIANMGTERKPKYTPIVGIAGYRTLARRQSDFMVELRELTPEETKHRRGADMYDPQDVAYECKLYNLKLAQECKSLGIPYQPTVAYGYYRVRARAKYEWVNNRRTDKVTGWISDNIPETWTRHEVAEKRAEKNAIKRAYDLTNAEHKAREAGGNMDADEATYKVIDDLAEQHGRDTAPMAEKEIFEDGDLLFATDPKKNKSKAVEVEYEVVEDEQPEEVESESPDQDGAPELTEKEELIISLNEHGEAAYPDGWESASKQLLARHNKRAKSWNDTSAKNIKATIDWLAGKSE